ncbi:MAG: sodium:solute symporter family protein [Tissierellia bacterium]|nr:sodium:solute symporter family protein [Tissierellia bacterium]
MKYFIAIVIYLTILVATSIYFSKRKVKTSEDFAVAGRSLPMVVLIGTLLATWCGGGGITGSANVIYTQGPYVGALYFLGAPLGMALLYFIAGKVRMTKSYTVPQLFSVMYGDAAGIIATICIFLAYVGIIASQFMAAGNILNLTTGVSVKMSTIIAMAVIILLTVTGGMISVAYTDALSAFLMVGGFLVALPIVFGKIGGLQQAFSSLPEGKNTVMGSLNFLQLLSLMMPTIFLVLGDQNLLQRFASAKDVKTAKNSNIGLVLAEIVVCVLIILLAMTGIFLLPTLDNPDTVIFQVALNHLPFILGALVLSASVAFVVTTGDSYLLSSSSNITYDLWKKYIKPEAEDGEVLRFFRIVIVLVGIFAFMLGTFFPNILTIQLYAYTMYGATITPALLCGLFYKKTTALAGTLGMISGGVMTLVWELVLKKPMGLNSALISVPVAFVVIFIVSLLDKNGRKVQYD